MFRIGSILITGLVIILLPGCASAPPGSISDSRSETVTNSEKASKDLDELFVEMHSRILEIVARIEEKDEEKELLIELRSIVEIAEETYLKGNPLLAVTLLKEAELLSRQTP